MYLLTVDPFDQFALLKGVNHIVFHLSSKDLVWRCSKQLFYISRRRINVVPLRRTERPYGIVQTSRYLEKIVPSGYLEVEVFFNQWIVSKIVYDEKSVEKEEILKIKIDPDILFLLMVSDKER